MSDALDELGPLEAELTEAGHLVCPVCRLAQAIDHQQCERCGADLGLLAATLGEARDRKQALFRALLAGDPVGALSQIDRLVQLTGPTLELAALRKVIRGGLVPIEVVDELRAELEPRPDDDPGTAYLPVPGDSPLLPPADEGHAAYAGLTLTPEPPAEEPVDVVVEPVVTTVTVDAAEPAPALEPEVAVTVSTNVEPVATPPEPVDVEVVTSAPPAVRPTPRAKAPDPLRQVAGMQRAMRLMAVVQKYGVLILVVIITGLIGLGYWIGIAVAGR